MLSLTFIPSLGPFSIIAGILLVIFAGYLIEELIRWSSWRYKRSLTGAAAIFGALITSSPELAIFIIAIIQSNLDIAWGSIIAQPFMVATIIYPVVILTALIFYFLGKRESRIPHVSRRIAIPLLIFTIPLLPILFLHPEKYGIIGQIYGLILILTYFLYARYMLTEKLEEAELVRLYLRNPILQTILAILILYIGAEWMVLGIEETGRIFGLSEIALSIIIIPTATVLPESIVGLIFIAKGEDDEGISVIVGEKALYGTFYPGLALALGIYQVTAEVFFALIITIIISILTVITVLYGYFGLTAPLGLIGYAWYVYFFLII